MKFKLFIALLLIGITSYAQRDTLFVRYDADITDDSLLYTIDTVLLNSQFDQVYLAGTTMLPNTRNQIVAMGYGLHLEEVSGSPCLRGYDPRNRENDKITSVDITDTLWLFDLQVEENCCHSFLGDLTVVEDSILSFVYYGYGGAYCACDCCFGISYVISATDYEDKAKVKYAMIGDDRRTIIKLDQSK